MLQNETDKSKQDKVVEVNGVSFSLEDIHSVIDDFYKRVQRDPVLQIPFGSVEDWEDHIERLTHFWWIRFGGEPYLFSYYNPVPKHFFAGFNPDLLLRWLSLFHKTLKCHLNQKQINLWRIISERMGSALSLRNELFRSQYEQGNLGANGREPENPNP